MSEQTTFERVQEVLRKSGEEVRSKPVPNCPERSTVVTHLENTWRALRFELEDCNQEMIMARMTQLVFYSLEACAIYGVPVDSFLEQTYFSGRKLPSAPTPAIDTETSHNAEEFTSPPPIPGLGEPVPPSEFVLEVPEFPGLNEDGSLDMDHPPVTQG